MTPLNWGAGVFEFVFMAGVLGSSGWVQVFCAVVCVAVLAFYFWAYAHWARVAPDRLQSESYNLKQRQMTLQAAINSSQEMQPASGIVVEASDVKMALGSGSPKVGIQQR